MIDGSLKALRDDRTRIASEAEVAKAEIEEMTTRMAEFRRRLSELRGLVGKLERGVSAIDKAIRTLESPAPPHGGVSPQASGGRARSASMSPERRSEVARIAAAARWAKVKKSSQ